MKDALAIHRMLLERETLHEIVRLPNPIASADDLPKAGLPAGRCLSTRIYTFTPRAARTGRGHRLAAVIVLAGAAVGTEPVRLALGARTIRPAGADLINSVTDFAAELVCPLLLPDSVTVLIDRRVGDRLQDDDVVYTATGESWTALGIRAADLRTASGARPVDLMPTGTAAVPVPRRGHRSIRR
jgi:prolyl-tRNA editing enzyme YbaK/EbsC (Cys-tRNA(Pro) deacylase)